MSEATEISPEQAALDIKALNLFSRQNAALGAETTAKLTKMKVLIYGLRGVGVETAKNLALQGAGAMTLIDSNLVEERDIGVNFFLTSSDVGKTRSSIVAPKLKELNPLCLVTTAKALDETTILNHSAVVITQILPLDQLLSLNALCRTNNISFFYTFTGGVSVDVFVDHGDKHIVNDFNGERPIQKLITDIVPLSDSETLIRYETPEGQQPVALSSGFYEVSEVEGVEPINSGIFAVTRDYKDPVKTVRVPYAFPASLKYKSGGLLTEKKVPTPYPMESLAHKLKNPGDTYGNPPTLVLTDLINFGSEVQQHVAFYAVATFFTELGRLPAPNSAEDAASTVEIAKRLIADGSIALESFDLDEKIVSRYAIHAGVELQPMAAFIGGVLAQEVVKCTGKFTPIPGFMHFSAPEALPNEAETPSAADTQPRGSRYDELAAVYGWPFVEKLGNLKYFMVGCGALGCEFMKNFALNGVCCGPKGKLVVTDADRIELSNLSRQFLFREHNVGQPKSRAAGTMAKVMNQNFNVEAMELFVGPKTEDVFNDTFWESLDGICNALDNMEARLYVDRQSVIYEKSLLESGTMGTGGNIDTVCPFKTRTFAEGGNAAEGGGVPMCTLRNFPHLTDHCIEWARDQFELLFVKLGKSLEAYLQDPVLFESKIKDKAGSEPGAAFFDIRSVTSFAKFAAHPSIGGAAQLAFDVFHFLFRDRILDLQAAFPADFRVIDEKTKEDKGPFWGEKKRYPTVAVFNPDDSAHTDFVLSATCLFSVMVGLIPPKKENDDSWLQEYRDKSWIVGIAAGLTPPPYLQAPVNSDGIDNAPAMDKEALDGIINGLCDDLRSAAADIKLTQPFEVADFEKDDDLNFHIAMITSAANLRCDNYSIKRTDFHSCKVIAGKIIAAIATTTAAVCGLVMLELFKLQLNKDTDSFMNRAIGLSGYMYTSFTAEAPNKMVTTTETIAPSPDEPLPADAYDERGVVKEDYKEKVVRRAYPENHTIWDKLTVSGSLTLKEFSDWFLTEHGLKMRSWDFIYGHKTSTDLESKAKQVQGVSAPVYPPKPVLDYSLLPSLDLTLQQATMALMKSSAKPTQQYLALWREFKAAGAVPPQPAITEDVITENSTLKQILQRMVVLADEAEAQGLVETKAISSLTGRKFVVIPGGETPLCVHAETNEDIEHMCAIKIVL
eukprot:CAMPEP_0170384462 /NCGR_PEP_ID=MMETSP0117_2-20130122/16010_1 /TAXON_ID=400756 /ORGANISM="Durinskia baltica, Strain CSIRO CS-38" /LENGTH=1179 /DNA_ID=CAMNT_0010640211 /DNA_START=97 /DNA_END=3636 /DNA_ORIENTATION=-